jgi:O-antigen biosynthesis protein
MKINENFTGERLTIECYNQNKSLFLWHYSRYKFASQFLTRKDRVLDLACGVGYGSYLLSLYCNKTIGLDIDEKAIQFALQNYTSTFVEFYQHDIRSTLQKYNNSFNVVVSFETIEHLSENDQKIFLENILSMICTDGILIISTPNKEIYNNFESHLNHFHLHELNHEEYKGLLSKYFNDVAIIGQQFSGKYYLNRSYYKLYKLLTSINIFKKKSISPLDSYMSLDDFEFTTEDVLKSRFLIAICRSPIKK